MRRGARVYYEPSAVAFAAAPTRLVHLARRRARWARGMIEGIRSVKPWNQPRWMLRFLTGIDLLIPARVFNLLGLQVRRNTLGFLGFVLAYQILMSPIAVVGYGQELLGLRRHWK